MNGFAKSGVVLAGYAVAVLLASVAVAVRIAQTSGPDAQASAGMYAFGDLMLFVAVFGVAAIPPTGLAFFFLRPYRAFWIVIPLAGLAFAATGLAAALVYVSADYWAPPGSTGELWAGLAVLRMLPAPLLVIFFLLSAFVAPNPSSRRALLVATGMESAVGIYTVLHWFAPCCFT